MRGSEGPGGGHRSVDFRRDQERTVTRGDRRGRTSELRREILNEPEVSGK